MKYKLILASGSPRRRELLAGLDRPFEVRLQEGIAENYPATLDAHDVPEYISREKAAAYTVAPDELLIAADTVVVLDKTILGKPHDEEDACRMLRMLSGNTHHVVSGVTLRTAHAQRSFSVTTEVSFKELTDDEIHYYVSHYHPLDKAGAYGIQEWIGFVGCVGLKGSFYNVMGLPVQRVYEEIRRIENGDSSDDPHPGRTE